MQQTTHWAHGLSTTSHQRRCNAIDIASMLMQCCHNVECMLGSLLPYSYRISTLTIYYIPHVPRYFPNNAPSFSLAAYLLLTRLLSFCYCQVDLKYSKHSSSVSYLLYLFGQYTTLPYLYADNPLCNDTRYNDKIRYNDNLTVAKPLLKRLQVVTNYARILF